jgi:hypothetical protein
MTFFAMIEIELVELTAAGSGSSSCNGRSVAGISTGFLLSKAETKLSAVLVTGVCYDREAEESMKHLSSCAA